MSYLSLQKSHMQYRAELMEELARYLDRKNQNLVDGDAVACIRDLAQIAIGNMGLVEELEQKLKVTTQELSKIKKRADTLARALERERSR